MAWLAALVVSQGAGDRPCVVDAMPSPPAFTVLGEVDGVSVATRTATTTDSGGNASSFELRLTRGTREVNSTLVCRGMGEITATLRGKRIVVSERSHAAGADRTKTTTYLIDTSGLRATKTKEHVRRELTAH